MVAEDTRTSGWIGLDADEERRNAVTKCTYKGGPSGEPVVPPIPVSNSNRSITPEMCYRTYCTDCKKVTGWKGCGQHAEQVMEGVTTKDRCSCEESLSEATVARDTSGDDGRRAENIIATQ